MANYDIRPLQLHILNMLVDIDKVCKKNNLRYYIMAGTLLGAIRHKGFIPWDDDIDIGIPRNDYDLLIKNAKEWLPKPYEIICGENDEAYTWPFAKIQDSSTTLIEKMSFNYLGGVYVDVFPLDGVPNNKLLRRIHFAKYSFYKKVLYLTFRDPYKHGKGINSWIPLLCRKIFNTSKVQRSIRNILSKYNFDNCSLIADYDDRLKGVMSKDILGKPTPVLFEGKEFMGVENFHAYLKQKYGNYMEIPKKGKQRQHNFHYLDINTPYRDYLKSR